MVKPEKKVLKAVGKLKPTDWKTATPAVLGAAAFADHIREKLDYFKFRSTAPIRSIIGGPTDLYLSSAMSNAALLTALMGNMYGYGRTNWKWVRGSPKAASDPYEDTVKVHVASLDFPAQLRWKSGRGLLDGTVTSAVCGSFNSAMKFMAHEIFDIPGVKGADGTDATQIPDSFITLPGSQPIDANWNGNVWFLGTGGTVAAASRSNTTLRALRFTGHYFLNHAGTIYDATGNKTWAKSTEMIWCKLAPNNAKTASFPGARGVFNVNVVNAVGGTPAAKYCVDLGEEPGDADRFSNWLLTDRESATAGEMKTMATWSSCA